MTTHSIPTRFNKNNRPMKDAEIIAEVFKDRNPPINVERTLEWYERPLTDDKNYRYLRYGFSRIPQINNLNHSNNN